MSVDAAGRPPPTTGVVLAAAAALGAYEAGVLSHIVDRVAREVGRPQLFDLVSGTSAGAINALAVGAFAHDPIAGAQRMCETWSGLRLGQILRPSAIELLRMLIDFGEVTSRIARALAVRSARGGLLDPQPIASLLERTIPIERLHANLAAGLVRSIAITATHVASGRAAVFHETAGTATPTELGLDLLPTRLETHHALASASIPLMFPPVLIDGELYCDGGLRQLVPLSPSVHLGARRLLVINPLAQTDDPIARQARRQAMTSPIYLAGKALNALLYDRTEIDLARLAQITGVLRAGRRRFGPSFDDDINDELEHAGAPRLHEVKAVAISPSQDLAQLAAAYATSGELERRERGIVTSLVRRLGEFGAARSGDLLAFLLFDGGFASQLIALGRRDAQDHHAELVALFAPGSSPDE
jgi:NTE family protein